MKKIKNILIKFLNDFLANTEELYRNANIIGVLNNKDKDLMKKLRKEIKRINEKN